MSITFKRLLLGIKLSHRKFHFKIFSSLKKFCEFKKIKVIQYYSNYDNTYF